MDHRRVLLITGLVAASSIAGMARAATEFEQTNLVSDGSVPAFLTDSNLINPWGISEGPSTPFWISDNGKGVATLYQVPGPLNTPVAKFPPLSPLVVTIPPSVLGTTSAPTGQVFNGTSGGFKVSNGNPALFIFDSEDGAITAWNLGLGTTAEIKINKGAGAVYKGLAIDNTNDILYATNFRAGTIEAYNSDFKSAMLPGSFTDPNLPTGYAPFNAKDINGQLYVTYAVQDPAKHDDEAGPGNGLVDIFDLNGDFVKRLVSHGVLNSPWGLQIAPAGFGTFAGDLLVGNFGDGTINAFDPATGAFMGTLDGKDGKPLFIQDLWALTVGNGSPLGGSPFDLYFTAGLVGEGGGLFGSLAVPEPSTWVMLAVGFVTLGIAGYWRTRKARLEPTRA